MLVLLLPVPRSLQGTPVIGAERYPDLVCLPPADRAALHLPLPAKKRDEGNEQEQEEEREAVFPEYDRHRKRGGEQEEAQLPGLRFATSRTAKAGRASAAGPIA